MNRPSQVYKDLAFCENPLEREQEVEDVKVEKVQSLQEVSIEHWAMSTEHWALSTEEFPWEDFYIKESRQFELAIISNHFVVKHQEP